MHRADVEDRTIVSTLAASRSQCVRANCLSIVGVRCLSEQEQCHLVAKLELRGGDFITRVQAGALSPSATVV